MNYNVYNMKKDEVTKVTRALTMQFIYDYDFYLKLNELFSSKKNVNYNYSANIKLICQYIAGRNAQYYQEKELSKDIIIELDGLKKKYWNSYDILKGILIESIRMSNQKLTYTDFIDVYESVFLYLNFVRLYDGQKEIMNIIGIQKVD